MGLKPETRCLVPLHLKNLFFDGRIIYLRTILINREVFPFETGWFKPWLLKLMSFSFRKSRSLLTLKVLC